MVRAYLDEVVVQPVEMGFSEWGTSCTAPAAAMAVAAAAAAAPINGAQRAEQTGEAPIAAAAAINPSNDNNPWVLGQGEGTAVAVQVCSRCKIQCWSADWFVLGLALGLGQRQSTGPRAWQCAAEDSFIACAAWAGCACLA